MEHVVILEFVEGPAGSGKTTYLRESGRFDYTICLDRDRKKSKKQGEQAFLDHLLRLEKLQQILETTDGTVRVGIDRSLLSQDVYSKFRGEPCSTEKLILLYKGLDKLSYGNLHFEVEFTFLLPSLETLIRRRKTSGREYPYDPEEELRHYSQLYHRLSGLFSVQKHSDS